MKGEPSTNNDRNRDGLERGRRALRFLVVAILPALVAFAIEERYWRNVSRYSAFYAAVFVSAWVGGASAGIVATMLSAALVWWYAVPRVRTLGTTEPQYVLTTLLFIALGLLISVVHGRLRRSRHVTAAALADLRRSNAELEQAIRARRIFQAFIENSSDFIGIADAAGTPTYLNPAGRRMVGLAPDFPIETTRIPEYYPSDVRSFAADVIVKGMVEQGRWTGETYFRNWQTGEPIPVSDTHFMIRDPETGAVLGMGTITRDISAIKKTRDELEMANQQLRRTADELAEAQRVAHVGSWNWNFDTGVMQWSDEMYRIFGRDLSAPLPRSYGKRPRPYTPESLEVLDAAIEKIKQTGEPQQVDLEFTRPDGERRWIASRAEAVHDASGRIAGIRGTAVDITELKALQRLREEWTSVIAHDLRNPIGVIKTSAELLPDLHTGSMAEDERTIVERVRSAAEALNRMVSDLLDLSRLESHRLTLEQRWVDPITMVREVLERLSFVTANARTIVEAPEHLPLVWVDPVRFDQIVGNLITNAVKYGDQERPITVRLAHRGDEVEISVTNHGSGIPPDELPRLFGRFARLSSAAKAPGLGLGLYISKGLVEAQGGRMWVESTPGETTTFHFTLPCHVVGAAAA